MLTKANTATINTGVKLSELIKRTELNYEMLAAIDKDRPVLSKSEAEEVNIEIKYEGYIKLQLEKKIIPDDIDFEKVSGIRIEARQKLNKFRPHSIGQASRISGISPADISVLLIYLHEIENK